MKPLDIVKPSGPWYSCQQCGVNKLMSMVKSMFSSIGISGKSNHSLRASGATEMFKAGVPEKIIQERTGHRSLKLLGHTSVQQKCRVSPLQMFSRRPPMLDFLVHRTVHKTVWEVWVLLLELRQTVLLM